MRTSAQDVQTNWLMVFMFDISGTLPAMAHLLLHPLLRPLVEALRPQRRRRHRPVLRARVRRLRRPRRRRRGRGRRLRAGVEDRAGLVRLRVVNRVSDIRLNGQFIKDVCTEGEGSTLSSCKDMQFFLDFLHLHSYLARRWRRRPGLPHRSIGRGERRGTSTRRGQ